MGWSKEKYLKATIEEYSLASSGYWRNWERNTAWLMREIVYELIAGNPNYKNENKPPNSRAVYSMKDDEKAIEKKKKELQTSPEELEAIRQELLNKMNSK